MSRVAPLPQGLESHAFSVQQGRDAGLSVSRMRHDSLLAPTRGLRAAREPASVDLAARAVSLVMVGPYAFSHLTAARLLGLPTPRPWSPQEPIHAIHLTSDDRVRRLGVVGHRGLELRRTIEVQGLTVTDHIETWMDVAGWPLDDLIVAAEAFVGASPARLDALLTRVGTAPGKRGIRRLRLAAEEVRIGSRSPRETLTRLVLTRGGVAQPCLNAPIHDATGGWLAIGDVVWYDEMVVGEYQGEHHFTVPQRAKDLSRRRSLEQAGWRVEDIIAADLSDRAHRAHLVTHFAAVLRERAGWAERMGRIQ